MSEPPVQATLSGRHAVVTGASRGIGAAVAVTLARAGARVSLLGRDLTGLRRIASDIGSDDRAVPLAVDVTDPSAVTHTFVSARERFGPVHILVNNAGQAASAKFTDTSERLWHEIFATNVTGTFLCTREAVPDMLAADFGRIVNVASTAGLRGAPFISAYASSKHAVVGLTRSLALEFAPRHITVNAVCPGFVDTDIVTRATRDIAVKTGRSDSEARAALAALNPQKRLLEPQEVATAVLWLCGPGAETISGQTIVLGGEPT